MATDDRSTESTVLGGSGGDMGRSIEAAVARAIAGNGPVGESDVAALGAALFHCGLGLARNPYGAFEATSRYGTGLLRAGFGAAARLMGLPSDGPVPEKQDKRFDDPAWSDNVAFWWLRQVFALTEQLASDLVAESDLEERTKLKAAFATQLMLDAMSPTNLAITNPTVLKRAFDSGGVSLAKGFRNFLDDFASNQGRPRQVQPGVYEVGRNLAVTPGKVVFRNGLMELIQYAPQTDEVYDIPLLFSPPWINKYYVMDLAPRRSLVEWAVQQGHTVFTISYSNPGETMRDVRLDDYLLSGPLSALDVITDITGAAKVNLLGLCLGGTLAMALLAYLDAVGDDRINSATFLNTLVDFSEPGVLGVFTDEQAIGRLEKRMSRKGFLSGQDMRNTFELLRGNDLIWNYVVNNWLLGNDPPAFDLLTWNADSTRMPAGIHSFYLRNCYLNNELAKGTMELAGQRLDVRAVDHDLYVVGAEQDHIAPWRSSYKGALLPKGNVRFVLSNSGHIAGIVNPPNPKSRFWASDNGELPPNAETWRQQAVEHRTTWWEDWASWIAARAGEQHEPPPLGSSRHPARHDAPGEYVLEK